MVAHNNKASDLVYDFIIEMIQEGKWVTDTRIWPETKLAKELHVSRVAVRDAVQRLSAMSILRKVQGSGTYVEGVNMNTLVETLAPIAGISDEDLMDIMEFRLSFECGNVVLFIENATNEEIFQLEDTYKRMVLHKDSLEVFHKADWEFHNIIAKGTRNSFVSQINEICRNVLVAQHKQIGHSIGTAVGIEDHANILKHIKERDVELAKIYMERHLKRIIKSMQKERN